ncbi:RICIN domain-containing protein [Dactylosporangium sp. AC04546]|uniref:RICIN domain-containing protein n=1 Tax=Dactylosporangium sp. AC04546 TaxID=2862460 RepID=UPI002E7BD960|nr:RICIN domain-containing protein [Dactylosporangium sp. AC04546]WVK78389.1 RICIN domain-containing protein [Dactylosporangium sp. AC04546]
MTTAYDTMDARPIPLDPRRAPILVRPYVSALDEPKPVDRTDWPLHGGGPAPATTGNAGKAKRRPGATIPAELRDRTSKGSRPAREGQTGRGEELGQVVPLARPADVPQARVAEDAVEPRGGRRRAAVADDTVPAHGGQTRADKVLDARLAREGLRDAVETRADKVLDARLAREGLRDAVETRADKVLARGGRRDAVEQDAVETRGARRHAATAGGGVRAARPATPFGTPAEPDSATRVAEDMPGPRSARPARPSRAAATGGDRRTGQARAAQRGAARAVPGDYQADASPETRAARRAAAWEIWDEETGAHRRAAGRGETRADRQAAGRATTQGMTRAERQAAGRGMTKGMTHGMTRREARAAARAAGRRGRRDEVRGDYRGRHTSEAPAVARRGGRRRVPALGWGMLALTVGTTGLVLGMHEQAATSVPTAVALTSPQVARPHSAAVPAPVDGDQGAKAAAAAQSRTPRTAGHTTGAPAPVASHLASQAPPAALHANGPIRSFDGQCLDGDALLLLADCDGSAAQAWTAPGDGTLRLAAQCLQAGGAALTLQPCDGSAAQAWTAQPGDAAEVASVASGLCLDPGAGTVPGLANCDGTDAQRWHLP